MEVNTSSAPLKGSAATKVRILDATAEEMASAGLDGVRIEHVAARAGCNKALIYRYFHDRETLFAEAFRRQLEKRMSILGKLPEGLAPIMQGWTRQTLADKTFVQLFVREAMDYDGGEPVEMAARQAYYARQVGMVRAMQAEGGVDAEFDEVILFLALLGLIMLPSLLPQIVYLVTGVQADSAEFDVRWGVFLEQLAGHLG